MKRLVKESLEGFLFEDETQEIDDEGGKPANSGVKGFHNNIEEVTLANDNFRKVLYTAKNLQLVVMTLKPGENIGMERHDADQFFRFEAGTGESIINGNKYSVSDGDSVIVPGGAEHDVINTGKDALQMYILYSPPNHTDKIVHPTKEDAVKDEKSGKDKFRGETTE